MRSIADCDPLITPRSDGLHLSQIYNDIEATLAPREEMEESQLSNYRAGGFLWERLFSSAMADSIRGGDIVRPGEFAVDGIAGSPDNLRIDPWRVIETKCTWRSVQKFDDHMEKFMWTWLVQMKGYCRMVGALQAELYCFFINGDYRGSGPLPRGLLLSWSQLEIDENWRMITGHARNRGWL